MFGIFYLRNFLYRGNDIYKVYWIKCTNSCDTGMNDLSLINDLYKYKDISVTVAMSGISAISRHLWYLGEETIPFALFSDEVSAETKKNMVELLISLSNVQSHN